MKVVFVSRKFNFLCAYHTSDKKCQLNKYFDEIDVKQKIINNIRYYYTDLELSLIPHFHSGEKVFCDQFLYLVVDRCRKIAQITLTNYSGASQYSFHVKDNNNIDSFFDFCINGRYYAHSVCIDRPGSYIGVQYKKVKKSFLKRTVKVKLKCI